MSGGEGLWKGLPFGAGFKNSEYKGKWMGYFYQLVLKEKEEERVNR